MQPNSILLKSFFFFAVFCWLCGVTVHALAFSGMDVEERFPLVWLMHGCVFVVFIPALINQMLKPEMRELQRTRKSLAVFKVMFRGVPVWLLVLTGAGLVYAFVNFMLFMKAMPGTPSFRDGQYILQSHGTILQTITETEYHAAKAQTIRGFSGHWIAFFGIGVAMLYPFKKV